MRANFFSFLYSSQWLLTSSLKEDFMESSHNAARLGKILEAGQGASFWCVFPPSCTSSFLIGTFDRIKMPVVPQTNFTGSSEGEGRECILSENS